MTRLGRAWQALDHERRIAAVAAVALVLTMFLPWYQQNGVVNGVVVSRDLNAFAVFSFIEGAILLAALAVLLLLFARAERRNVPVTGKDGRIVLLAGGFVALLLIVRLFDKPGVSGNGAAVDVGIQWGIFFALAAAGLLAYAGARLRASQQEPPLLRGRRGWRGPGGGPGPHGAGRGSDWRAQAAPRSRTQSWQRAPLALPPTSEQAGPADPKIVSASDARPKRRATAAARQRAHADQLSFEEDSPDGAEEPFADATKPPQRQRRP